MFAEYQKSPAEAHRDKAAKHFYRAVLLAPVTAVLLHLAAWQGATVNRIDTINAEPARVAAATVHSFSVAEEDIVRSIFALVGNPSRVTYDRDIGSVTVSNPIKPSPSVAFENLTKGIDDLRGTSWSYEAEAQRLADSLSGADDPQADHSYEIGRLKDFIEDVHDTATEAEARLAQLNSADSLHKKANRASRFAAVLSTSVTVLSAFAAARTGNKAGKLFDAETQIEVAA